MPPEGPAPSSLRATYDGLMTLITGRTIARGPAPDPASLAVGDARGDARTRVHVYEHMYRARIVEALEEPFPRLARWLGGDDFAALAAAYIADEPSRHPSLRFVGERLPDWLARRPTAEARHAALADLARLEWARADVFDAADDAPLAIEALRAWPADRFAELPLRLVSAHRRLTVAHPVAALWDAIGPANEAPPEHDDVGLAAPSATAVAVAEAAAAIPRDESLLVWRQGSQVFHRATDPGERAALDAIARGTTFGLVCEALGSDRPAEEAAAQAFLWLSTWSADELLAAD